MNCFEVFASGSVISAEDVAQVLAACSGQPYALEERQIHDFFRELGTPPRRPEVQVFLFLLRNAATETVAVAFWRKVFDQAELDYLLVAGQHRGAGLGRQMLELSHGYLSVHGVSIFSLEVSEKNGTAINLYESLGYSCVYLRKKYYSNGEDARCYDYYLDSFFGQKNP